MARRASVRYWPSREAYCCWFKGHQHTLAEGPDDFPDGPTYQAALDAFKALTALGSAESAGDKNTCRVVCEMYLRHISTRRKEGTLKVRQRFYGPFTDELGETEVRALTHHSVYSWLDTMRQWRKHPKTGRLTRWTNSSVRNACTSLQAAFNWASRTGLITKNPLVGLESPAPRSRGREALLGKNPEERRANHERILAKATKYFRPLVIVLEATGCRPSEIANATAADFDLDIRAIVYPADDKRNEGEFSHKTAGKGKDRIILLSGQALELVKQAAREHPRGPLFLTRRKAPWTERDIAKSFRDLRVKIGMSHLTAYSYRHTFATAWLEQGRSVDILAELLGNSPIVIRKHYSHLLGDRQNLRQQMDAFRAISALEGGTGNQSPSVSRGEGERAAG
jgi:integrase